MKFNIYFTMDNRLRGERIVVPNNTNPIECVNLAGVLLHLSQNLPRGYNLEPVGIRIEPVAE